MICNIFGTIYLVLNIFSTRKSPVEGVEGSPLYSLYVYNNYKATDKVYINTHTFFDQLDREDAEKKKAPRKTVFGESGQKYEKKSKKLKRQGKVRKGTIKGTQNPEKDATTKTHVGIRNTI